MIILASASPRRKELLSLITNDFVVMSPSADETLPKGILPQNAVVYLSKIKAQAINNNSDIVIGADTVVAIDNCILGKPKDKAQAKEMLKTLSGKTHSVFTGVTVINQGLETSFFCETKVTFFTLTDKEIDDYISTKEPFDKAGAYGIQGKGALFVEKIDGDYFNVVGLPISALAKVLPHKD